MNRKPVRQAPPIGIIITMGKEVLDANGGGAEWAKHFESCVRDENSGFWLHKAAKAPIHDIGDVYVIAENFVQYRVFYGGYERGPTSVWMRSGEERKIDWPRMVLGGPFERCPNHIDIPMRGFQGFRYIYNPLW